VRGGEAIDPAQDRSARLHVAKELGHARINISNAYLGGLLQRRPAGTNSTEADHDDS